MFATREGRRVIRKQALIVTAGVFHTVGGIAAVNRLVLKALIEAGYDLEVLCLGEREATVPLPPELRRRISYTVFKGSKVSFTLSVWYTVLTGKRDLILCDHINIASILAPLSMTGLLRYSVWVYGVEAFPPNPDWRGALGLRCARRILAISPFTRDQIVARYPSLSVLTCDLALPPDREFTEASVREAKSCDVPSLLAMDESLHPLGSRVILHVGRMPAAKEQDKGQGTLIRAMPKILARFPDAQLVLAGDGENFSRLAKLARQELAGHLKSILMPGYVSDELLKQLFKHCCIFAMPSRSEGFGLVFIEAMIWAKPCIGSWLDASQCVIRDGSSGLLVSDPASVEEVADKIIWLLARPDRAHEMGQEGRQLVHRFYRYPHFKKRFLEAIHA